VALAATSFLVLADGVMFTEAGPTFEYATDTGSWLTDDALRVEKIRIRSSAMVAQCVNAERRRRIREQAYQLSERRGFLPGYAIHDWLASERRVDEDIVARRRKLRSSALFRQENASTPLREAQPES